MMHYMTTSNPRLTITLTPSLAACLRRLSEVTGSSQSRIISDLLEGSVPVFERIIETIELAKVASASIRGKLASDMQLAQSRIESQLGMVYDELDGVTDSLLDAAEVVKRRARRESTPMSNRGVSFFANPVNEVEKESQ